MGFLDRAKQAAEQAQKKLDEVQSQRNARAGQEPAGGGAPPVQYDQHGRPIRDEAAAMSAAAEAARAAAQPVAPPPPPPDAAPPAPEPAMPGPGSAEDRGAADPAKSAPKGPPGAGSGLTGGDPLAG